MPSQVPTADGISIFVLEMGRVVRELREERGMSLSELAGTAGTARSTLERFDGGKSSPQMPADEPPRRPPGHPRRRVNNDEGRTA